mgnify:CR=1 FL=1
MPIFVSKRRLKGLKGALGNVGEAIGEGAEQVAPYAARYGRDGSLHHDGDLWVTGLEECCRVARRHVIVKCQDQVDRRAHVCWQTSVSITCVTIGCPLTLRNLSIASWCAKNLAPVDVYAIKSSILSPSAFCCTVTHVVQPIALSSSCGRVPM